MDKQWLAIWGMITRTKYVYVYLRECATHTPTKLQLGKEQLRRNKPNRERWRDILLQNLMTHVITIWYDSFPKKAPLMSQIAQSQSALINVQWVRRQREVHDSRDSLVFFSLQVVLSKLCGVFGLCCSMNPSPQRCTPMCIKYAIILFFNVG